ncbi:HNH endonuclease family protein [Leifsonia sp. NPDC056824]|uniref:HNH endonuclease family protein n=1 Tax=Leifsonia sp. NPDC056824 TaxID=3345953 RepID=UPI0036A557BE
MSRTSARRRRPAPWPVAVVALLLALAGAGGYAALNGKGTATAPTTAAASSPALVSPPGARSAAGLLDASGARAALAQLPVKGRAPATGYDRVARFGEAWLDVDKNGCDTRDDILARDLAAVTRRTDCAVLTGTLNDPYTGRSIAFTRGVQTSALVQIDHVVALLDAWETGAQGLSQETRVQLANDPLALLAVDGATNQAKGAGDAATWLPPNRGFRCEYAARQVSVKAKYGLWVTAAEGTALKGILAGC